MKNEVKVLMIDANKQSITEAEFPHNDLISYARRFIGGNVEVCRIDRNGNVILVDEDGQFKRMSGQPYSMFEFYGKPIIGNAVVLSVNGRNNFSSSKLTIEDLQQVTMLLGKQL